MSSDTIPSEPDFREVDLDVQEQIELYTPTDTRRDTQARVATFAQVNEGRYNNFDFIRFFMASLVIFAHSFGLMLKGEPLNALTRGQMGSGGLAVLCFFLLSGFLITKSWMQSPNLGKFLERRVRRIMPGFVVALLFCVFVVGPLSGVPLGSYFRNPHTYAMLTMALGAGEVGIPGVFAHNPLPYNVNGALWTIRIELLCYLLVAALGVASLLRWRRVVLTLFVLTLVVSILHTTGHPGGHWPYLIEGLVGLTPIFLAGAVFYSYRDRILYHFGLAAASLILLGVCCWAKTGMIFVLPFCGAYLLFYVAFSSRLKLQNFGRHGDLSYGVYLYGFPVQQLLIEYGRDRLTPPMLFVLALLISSGLATLSWFFVEKPFLHWQQEKVSHTAK